MYIWLIPVITIVIALSILSLVRLKIPHDTGKEGIDDFESTRAYDTVSRWPVFALIRFYVIRQLDKYRPQGRMMDAGCGPGYLAAAISRKYPQLLISGIDISPLMLGIAVPRFSTVNSKIQFTEADIQRLPFTDGYLDFAVSTLSFHHWSNPKQALSEIHRVLCPGGQLLIFDLRRDMPYLLYHLIHIGQRFLAPSSIRRVNGGVGSIWSSYRISEMRSILSNSPFRSWKVQQSWGWAYIWAQK